VSWRTWFALFVVSLVAVAFVTVKLRRGESTLAAAPTPAHVGVFSAPMDIRQFQRGSIHAHTLRSDGHQSPREVATWYRDHGYQFLAITDHNVLVDPAELADLEGPGFALVPGEEISSTVGPIPVHVQALCIDHLIAGAAFDTPGQALGSMIAAVRAQNGAPVVNHPNFSWAFGITDLAPLTGAYALEIWSGHPAVYSMGDGKRPSHETMWDELLTRGRPVTAVAVDDVHTLVPLDGGSNGLPGLGWIYTFGELGRAPICEAIRGGRYYPSSGVAFRRIQIEPRRFTVWVDDAADTIVFLGSATQVLGTVTGDAFVRDEDGFAASYTLHGGETYVRVQARAPDGRAAWTQAYTTTP
jgi:predicted metal-dependent phosphoesterase TrpH